MYPKYREYKRLFADLEGVMEKKKKAKGQVLAS